MKLVQITSLEMNGQEKQTLSDCIYILDKASEILIQNYMQNTPLNNECIAASKEVGKVLKLIRGD